MINIFIYYVMIDPEYFLLFLCPIFATIYCSNFFMYLTISTKQKLESHSLQWSAQSNFPTALLAHLLLLTMCPGTIAINVY